MSLEKAIEANTLALQEMAQHLQDLTAAVLYQRYTAITLPPALLSEEKLVVKAPAKETPATEIATPAAKVTTATPDAKVTEVEDPLGRVWTYEELGQDFLALVKSDKPKALAILASLKIATLKEIKGKDVLYNAVAAKIMEARNG